MLLAFKGRGGAVVAEENLLKDVVGVLAAAELGISQAVDHGSVPLHGGFRVHFAPSSYLADGERSIRNTVQRGKMLHAQAIFLGPG